jgi:hypothetical protein
MFRVVFGRFRHDLCRKWREMSGKMSFLTGSHQIRAAESLTCGYDVTLDLIQTIFLSSPSVCPDDENDSYQATSKTNAQVIFL